MKAKEVCELLNISENALLRHFPRTKARFEKIGIIITRCGKEYFIEREEYLDLGDL